ncbi:MAG TPA: hypothetical protein VJ691_17105 [Vicinamibacterales bacterium]|nr:hypothetical protein [Vicinamibacterales bacterium]
MPTNHHPLCIAALLLAAVAAGCSKSPTGPSETTAIGASTTTLSFTSEPISVLGQARTYNLQNATFRAQSLRRGGAFEVTVRPTAPSDQSGPWMVLMSSPSGSGLTTGTFTTRPFTADNQWNFSFSGFGDRCGGGNASVTIHEIAIGETLVQRLRASFTVQCQDTPGIVRGEVVVLADPWR